MLFCNIRFLIIQERERERKWIKLFWDFKVFEEILKSETFIENYDFFRKESVVHLNFLEKLSSEKLSSKKIEISRKIF